MGYSSKHTALSHTRLSRSHPLARLPGHRFTNSPSHLKENTPLSPVTPTEIKALASDSFCRDAIHTAGPSAPVSDLQRYRGGVSHPNSPVPRADPTKAPAGEAVESRTLKTSGGASSYHPRTPAERRERGSGASQHNTRQNHVNLQGERETVPGVTPHFRFNFQCTTL